MILKEEVLNRQLEYKATMIKLSYKACETLGLWDGMMGIVVFLFHYIRQKKDAFCEKIAYELIVKIQDSIHVDFPINYSYGLTGIGIGIEYLSQQGFVKMDTDEVLSVFDAMFAEQVQNRKLYLSSQNLIDLKRYYSARLDNPKTNKRFFLIQATKDIDDLVALHKRVSVAFEDTIIEKHFPQGFEIWGLDGHAGKGLALLCALDARNDSWLKLR